MSERVGKGRVGHLLAVDAVIRMPEIGIELILQSCLLDQCVCGRTRQVGV